MTINTGMRVIEYLGKLYALAFGRPAFRSINRALFYLSGRGLGLLNYENLALSGERHVIRRFIERTGNPIVFDVGANAGVWSGEVLKHNENARLHLFEPQASLAEALKSRFPGAKVNNVAVADTPGMLTLYDYSELESSSHATLVKGVIETIHGRAARKVDVPVISLGDYCLRNAIDRIDFLKVDVEGFEYKVLAGARAMLTRGQIGVVQFEFNSMNRLVKVFVGDFLELFGDAYRIYRALPSGLLPLSPESTWLNEQFAFQNIVAVSRYLTDARPG